MTPAENRDETAALLSEPARAAVFLARDADGAAIAFAEATLRTDYVNGCTTSPVAFLEGIFVREDRRRDGVASLLCRAVEDWAIALGLTELASDADIANDVSHRMHRALRFEETERVVYFRKRLRPA